MATYKSFSSFAKSLSKQVDKTQKNLKSKAASAINKELTAERKEIVESLITKTGLKRKTLNDRLAITRANPKDDVLEGRITPLYGKRIYMTDYPFARVTVRGGRQAIRLTSPLYRKNMRTGFMSADGTRMYLRHDGSGNVRSVKGRSVPRLIETFDIKDIHEKRLLDRVVAAVKRILGGA